MAEEPASGRRARPEGAALRTLRILFVASFASAPLLAVATFLLAPLGNVQAQLAAVWMKIVTNGVFDHDAAKAAVGAALLALSAGASLLQSMGMTKLRLTLTERAGFWMDRRTAELVAGLPGLVHHEDPEYQNRVALLRDQRGLLGAGISSLLILLSTLGEVVLTVALLSTISTWLILVAVPSLLGIALVPLQQRRWRATEERYASNTVLDRALFDLATTEAPAKELRLYGLQEEMARRYEASWREVDRANRHTMRRSTVENTVTYGLPSLSVVGAVAFVALRASHGAASPGDVTMAAGLAAQLSGAISAVVGMSGWMLDAFRTAGRLIWLEDYTSSARPATRPLRKAPHALAQGITLERVGFIYPYAPLPAPAPRSALGAHPAPTAPASPIAPCEAVAGPALQGVDLHLPAGSVVALVGENGAGKTTLVKLLCRFYDPTEGRILVDGTDLREMAHEQWRENLAVGFQDFGRFELTLQHTVGVGNLRLLDEPAAVEAALARAGGADIASGLEGGLGAQLGRQWEGGHELSGGQWQKVAVARAFMREAPLLLVLDEPTAALDVDTEHALFESFKDAGRRLSNGAVTVLVSHRLSTVRMANLIVVMQEGRVRESGSHAELMALGGVYAELYELQARNYR